MSYKVCHLTTVHSPLDVRIFYKECKTLHEAGLSVVLMAQSEDDNVIDGIRIKALPKVKNRLSRMLQLPWIALSKALRENAAVYHFHDPELIPVALILKLYGKKVIYDVHEDVPRDILFKTYINPYLAVALSHFSEWLEDFSAKRFDGVVTATSHIGLRFSKINHRTVVVNNYPLLNEMYTPVIWEDRENCVAYVGGISRIRGIKEIVRSLELVDTKLLLAGRFEDEELEQEIKSMRGWEKVKYYGQVGREKVKEILGTARVGIVTYHPVKNHIESMPNKMFEYMSAGIPVVASNFPLWKEIVEGNNCGICVDPLNPEEIANAIEYLLKHPEEAKEMGENGRRAVEEEYNWDKESRKLVEIYRELLQEDQTKDYRPNLRTKRILHFL